MRVFRALFAGVALIMAALNVQGADFVEGEHYQRLAEPVRTADPERVEVVEVFGYWCPHCNNFERYLKPWKKKLSDQVDFKHLPVVFRPNQEEFARAYYIAEMLGVSEQTHSALFDLIHLQRRWIDNRQQLADFFERFDVSAEDFNGAYDSFGVSSKMRLGRKRVTDYGIQGVPSMLVNGRYRVTASTAGGQQQMLEVVDFLIAREQDRL